MKAIAAFVLFIDRINEWVGRGVAWLTLVMVLTTFLVVILRYGFALGWVWMQESYVWLHGVVFMVGAGYTLLHDGHVRVDIVYRPGSLRYKAWIDLGGGLILLTPFMVTVFFYSWSYVGLSWMRGEASYEAGGLPGLFLLKSMILIFCVLVGSQGLSLVGRSALVIAGDQSFARREEEHEII